jgi:hypothetical protein
MNEEEAKHQEQAKGEHADKSERPLYRVRLPRFITEEEVGLGDVIKRATSSIGIKPCGGCERRSTALNRWFVFSGRRSR